MSDILQMQRLVKRYQRRGRDPVMAVSDLDLVLGRAGSVHGFLGPNGSGKTTTIRCALGLIRPTTGAVSVFGHDATTSFHAVADRVGAIVENPKMFPHFTGRKNLQLLARMAGIDKRRVEEVLEVVDLHERGDDTFTSYSLGMKQRLAIAGALLKDPDLLILDEPANGLDPAGIAEMRVLIREIAGQGKAIVVSSHQLGEIEQVCDDVTIIHNGVLVVTGTLADVQRHAGPDRIVATIDDRDAAIATLTANGMPAFPRPTAREFFVEVPSERSSEVNRVLATNGLYLSGLRAENASLEQAFLNLTGASQPPPPLLEADAAPPGGAAPPPTAPPPGPPDAAPPVPPTAPPVAPPAPPAAPPHPQEGDR